MSRKTKKQNKKLDSNTKDQNKSPNVGQTSEEKELDKAKEDSKEQGKNDPAWYSRDERLVIDSASVPFSEPFGAPVKLLHPNVHYSDKFIVDSDQEAKTTPGIVTFDTIPSFGIAKDRLSPINVAATALYSQVRYVNNGRKNYDPADLMLYVGAVSDIYSYLNWMRRIYGCAMLYSQANKYIGKELLRAQGINPDSILGNLANFRYWINVYTNKVASYAVPADITLFHKRAFQFSSVYIEHDGDSIKDQLYMYKPAAFFKFRLDESDKGMLELKPITYPENGLTVDDLIAIGEDLLANIWGDEDFGLMSGDILRAFDGKILLLGGLEEGYTTIPVHDKLVLTQMENSNMLDCEIPGYQEDPEQRTTGGFFNFTGIEYAMSNGSVYQDDHGNLISCIMAVDYAKKVTQGATMYGFTYIMDKLLNIHESSADPATVIEAIQNAVCKFNGDGFTSPASSGFYSPTSTFATVVTKVEYFELHGDHVESVRMGDGLNYIEFPHMASQPIVDTTQVVGFTFKYMPKFAVSRVTNSGTDANPVYHVKTTRVLNTIDTYAILAPEQVARLQEVSLLSLLYVPGVAKYVNALA